MSACPTFHATCVAWLDVCELLWQDISESVSGSQDSDPPFSVPFFLFNPREEAVGAHRNLGLTCGEGSSLFVSVPGSVFKDGGEVGFHLDAQGSVCILSFRPP